MGSYISSAVSYYSPTQLPTATSATTGDDDSVDAFLEPPTAKRPRLDNDNDGGGTTASLSTMPDKDVHGATADKTAKPIDDVPLEGWIENWISYASYGWFVSDTVNFYDCTLKRTIVPGLLEMGGECSTIVVNLQRGYAQFIHADAQQAGHLRRTTIPFTMRIDAPIQINKGAFIAILCFISVNNTDIMLDNNNMVLSFTDNNAAVDSKDQDVSGATEPSSAFSAVHQAAAFARAKGHVWIGDIAQWASNEMDTTSPQRIVFRECQLTCTWIPSVLEESKCVDRIALCSPPQCLPILSYIHVTWSKKEPSLASSSYEPVNDIVDSDHHHSRIQIWWRWFPDQYSSYLDEVASFSAGA